MKWKCALEEKTSKISLLDSIILMKCFPFISSRWKKDNKLPNTKNVKKKNPDGSVQVTPGTGKGKGKRGGGKKQQQQQQTSQSEVKMEIFKDEDFHSIL